MVYGPKIIEHFQNPRCAGKIPDADGVATIAEGCGDVFRFYVKVRGNRLEKVRYEVKGCPVAIACCSMTAVLAEGKTLVEAMQITNQVVEKALGGLPPEKKHCSNLAADALYEAIQDYLYKRALEGKTSPARSSGDDWRNLYLQRETPGSKGNWR
ncbi:MAG: nitrogen fixation protein NifU [Thermacetogenium sp.]|uniref:NIF system FeS cluster assembly protein NifU n=1 Tax=Thermacetogenium phaeum TaxID=85874 RepID=A0A101FH37_9THEO|nr:MAG: NIF system FeS cluster assembly protein NifU [Thermacetogenium phaeum]MDN5365664.1 nitrogen fixation protein NifU [Thermacetogenium sp.]MDN5375815.1 nitrogen fixation protein NifU [Thermacetogenium sp.]